MRPHRRLLLRSAALAGAVLAFLPFAEWPTAMACVSALSPFVSLSAALGSRHLTLLTLVCLPLIVLAFLRQRWFCWNLCPTGFILELASLRPRSAKPLAAGFPHLGKWLLMLGIGMAAAGYPLLIIFDPLIILSGFLGALQWRNFNREVFVLAVPLFALIALNAIRPSFWCRRLCPLGAAQQFLGLAGRRFQRQPAPRLPSASHGFAGQAQCSGCSPPAKEALEIHESFPGRGVRRRFFMTSVLGGITGWAFLAKKSAAAVIRPPGSVNENAFTGLCARCGSCISACPENIIIPDFGASGLRGLLTPILNFSRGYCNEWCAKCLSACPTLAIRRLSLEQKRLTIIGIAQIDESLCLAWTHRQYCMVCQEFCPYQAIATVENGGVNCPEVRVEICNGCGACENHCPAIPQKAIVVKTTPFLRT